MVSLSKTTLRDMSAEFLGTMVLMLFGLGVNAQVTLGKVSVPLSQGELGRYAEKITEFQYGDYLSVNFVFARNTRHTQSLKQQRHPAFALR